MSKKRPSFQKSKLKSRDLDFWRFNVNENAKAKWLGVDSNVEYLDFSDLAELQWMETKKNKSKNRNLKGIDEPSFVKLLDARSVRERQRGWRLRCSRLKSSVAASLLLTLKKKKNDEPLDNFTFNHGERMNGDATSIYDHDMAALGIPGSRLPISFL